MVSLFSVIRFLNSQMKNAHVRDELAELLLKIEAELRLFDCWGDQPPSIDALQSSLPFCCDTLDVMQWLQFLFIPRMQQILVKQAELPNTCTIAPYLEECMEREAMKVGDLLEVVQQMDRICTNSA